MRQVLFCLSAIIILGASVSAQSARDGADLKRLLNEFLDGAGKNDPAVHDRFWGDELIYTRSAGQRIGKKELMAGVRSAPARKPDDPVTVYTAEDIRILQFGKTAVLAFRLVGTTRRADGTATVQKFFNTGTFVKRGGLWKAIAWQATIIPQKEQ